VGRWAEWQITHRVWDYSRAARTYIEIENTGDVLDFDATELRLEYTDDGFVELWKGRGSGQSVRLELPRVGRPVVLLAVGGGNQEFDHWSGETGISICAGQGARCEVPEPPEDYGFALYAKAVFKKKPEDKRIGPVDPTRTPAAAYQKPPQEP
jgi:hypothetical protein